jgi:hypothetical protein
MLSILEMRKPAGSRWLTSVILTTQEAAIRRIVVQSQPGQIVQETLSQKTHHKNKAGGVVKVKTLSSSLSTAKRKNERNQEGKIK